MMNDDSYPMSLFIVPVVGTVFSAVAFWLGVFPFAHLARWIANRQHLTIETGGFIAFCGSVTMGLLFGGITGGLRGAITYCVFFGIGSLAFWLATAKKKVEPEASDD